MKIDKIVKDLGLDIKFPHRHHGEYCYSWDGHRSDLDCSKVETPHECHRCFGRGTSTFAGISSDCGRCRGTGILGGDEKARTLILNSLKEKGDTNG